MKRTTQILTLLILSVGTAISAERRETNSNTGALKDLKTRAENGDAEAQAELGARYARYGEYANDSSVPQNYIQAVKWSRLAAEQGNARGQNNLGVCYSRGDGVPQDFAEATKWYRKAAEQGYAKAQRNLGISYARGDGVIIDHVEAAKWYRKAADQGLAEAEARLGYYYAVGKGVPQDFNEANGWLRKAAKQGNASAQYTLGVNYSKGFGVPKDCGQACQWLTLAIAHAKPGDFLLCSGLVAPPSPAPLVVINGVSIELGERRFVKTPIGQVWVKCEKFEGDKVQISVEGESNTRTLSTEKTQSVGLFQAAYDLRESLERQATREPIPERQRERKSETQKSTSAGTGFFVTDDGYLLTCEHVVRGASCFYVKGGHGALSAKLVKKDTALDIALLKVDGSFSALSVVRESEPKLGQSVFTIGYPNPDLQGLAPKLTRGEISSLAGIRDNPRYFQISVPVQPGNSGGALMDESGNVIGVVTARLDDIATYEASGALPQNVNYAVKGNLVREFLGNVPELSGKLKTPTTVRDRDAASAIAERAAVLVIAQ